MGWGVRGEVGVCILFISVLIEIDAFCISGICAMRGELAFLGCRSGCVFLALDTM